MADPGFPSQHTTTTVTSNTTVRTDMRFDPLYIRTLPGMLKVAQIIINLIGFICIECSSRSYDSRGNWYNFVAMTAFWFTGFLLLFYLFHVIEKFHRIPWLKIEMVYCGVWTLLYLIAASIAAATPDEAYKAAAFFGFCGLVVYGVDAFLKYKSIQRGELAQGDRVVTKQTTTTTGPGF